MGQTIIELKTRLAASADNEVSLQRQLAQMQALSQMVAIHRPERRQLRLAPEDTTSCQCCRNRHRAARAALTAAELCEDPDAISYWKEVLEDTEPPHTHSRELRSFEAGLDDAELMRESYQRWTVGNTRRSGLSLLLVMALSVLCADGVSGDI